MKKCPHCNSKKIVKLDNGNLMCRKCKYINLDIKELNKIIENNECK